jgi:hypothetical protein
VRQSKGADQKQLYLKSNRPSPLPLLKLAGDGQQHFLPKRSKDWRKNLNFPTMTERNFSEAGRRACTTESDGQRRT